MTPAYIKWMVSLLTKWYLQQCIVYMPVSQSLQQGIQEVQGYTKAWTSIKGADGTTILMLVQALYGGGLKYAKALDLLGPGWIVELDHNAANSMGSNLAGWRFGI